MLNVEAMNTHHEHGILHPLVVLILFSLSLAGGHGYTNLSISVYFRYQEVHSIPVDVERFSNQWVKVEKQVKVDKVYLETTRNAQLATESEVTALKNFFAGRGIKASAGLGLTVNEPNGFQSYCYSTPADRDRVKAMTEFTARHFDEIILDDFFFANCKCDRCIVAKGDRSWTRFRTEQMDEVSRELIIAAAKAVNPKVRILIKYPNWYESFQGLGYDLAVQPGLFDAIYTGTETRDPNFGQRLQPYQSYLQTQYFNNIKPDGNQGGWIDGGWDVERYAEQFWNTFFAKVPEITIFNSMQIMAPLNATYRGSQDTNATLRAAGLTTPIPQPDGSTYTPNMVARIVGCSAELLDRILGQLGKPVGVAVYKPCNSVGEAYLPNYLGMIGVPMDLMPVFPTNTTVLLTAASRFDSDLVTKVKKHLQAGGRVIATTGLIEAMGDKGFQGIAEIEVTGHRVLAKRFSSGRRSPDMGTATNDLDLNIVLPQMRYFENDSWPGVSFTTAASGYPMATSSSFGKGVFYVLAIPDDLADLYRLPQNVLNQIRGLLGRDVYVSLDAPALVSIYAYDNRAFIVQNYDSKPVNAKVSVVGATRLRDLLTDETIAASQSGAEGGRGFGRGNFGGNRGALFDLTAVPAHSFRVFHAE
jgi:hypothetical protein